MAATPKISAAPSRPARESRAPANQYERALDNKEEFATYWHFDGHTQVAPRKQLLFGSMSSTVDQGLST